MTAKMVHFNLEVSPYPVPATENPENQEAQPVQQQWYQKGKIDKKELDALYGRIESMLKSAGVF